MTPDRMKEIISDFTEAQGLDAPLKACACCGLRNLDSSSTTRSYREVDIADYKVQNMLKLRDETDDEGDIDGEDDPEEDGGDDNSDESLSVDDRSSDPMECEDTPQLDNNIKCDPLIQFGSAKTLQKHRRAMKEKPLSIPYNDDGDTKEVETWRLCSVWPARKPEDLVEEKEKLPDYLFDEESGEPIYYHLHPEFVQEKVPGDPLKGYTATICSECEKVIESGGTTKIPYPRRSIAAGVDFGDADRIGLEPLTERERQIISKVRHYLLLIKIESNTADGKVKERGQSAVKGCGIYFDDDSAQVVSDLLSQEGLNGKVSLQFVGPDGEYDSLAKKVLGSANVYGRAWVIYQWLKVLREVNLYYEHDDELPEFDEVKTRIEASNEALVKDAECVNDEGVVRETEIVKDDVRRVRTRSCSRGDTNAKEDGDFPFRCSLLTSSVKRDAELDRDYLESAAKALGTDEKKLYATAMSRREETPLNEYDNGDKTIAKSAPDVFIFGAAYENKGPTLNKYEREHLILQYTTNAASNRPLLFQLFESDRRHSVIRGMHAKVSSDQKGFEQFANEFSSLEFQAKLINATKNPKGKAAKYVLGKLVPVLTCAGKKSTFGALERNESAGQILALGRHFGCAPAFLTFGIDDVNHPNAIRFALRSSNNNDFPAIISSESQNELKRGMKLKDGEGSIPIPHSFSERLKLMINNPVGAAIAYKQVVHDVMTILFGIKPSNYSGDNNRTTKTEFNPPDKIGIVGTPWAFFGKTETTGSGSLHFHVVGWGGISPELLESAADIPELCQKIASVLDSQYIASLDRHIHVQDLVQKTIPTVKGLKKTCVPAIVKSGNSALDTSAQDTSDAKENISDINGSNLKDTNTNGSESDTDVHMEEVSHHASELPTQDTSAPANSVQDTLNGSQDTSTKLDGCAASSESTTKGGDMSSSLKWSKPRPIIPSKSSNANETRINAHKESWAPMVMHRPPDPANDGDTFKTFVSKIICRCGIHEHTFTCHKPPNGWHGCRLCYTRALNNGTKPIELSIERQPDGSVDYDMLDPCETTVTVTDVDGFTSTVKQEFVAPYDSELHVNKENLDLLQSGGRRTIVWELNRPELDPLTELDDDTTKEDIISKLYNEMLPSESVDEESQFEQGGDRIPRSRVYEHQFCEQDEHHLFYNLLCGLIESSQLKPGDKSVEHLRRELMQCLRKMPLNCKLGDRTLEQHIKSRMDSQASREDNDMATISSRVWHSKRLQDLNETKQEESKDDNSIEYKLKLYSQLMTNVAGDDCFEGGALEVNLFAKVMNVNVVVYDEEDDELIRVDSIDAEEGDRPIIHLLRTPNAPVVNESRLIKPPEYKYKHFTPKLKRLIDVLQTFDVVDLRRLYTMVSKSLVGRNEWVVDFNPLLTSLLGCNSNLLHLGSTEQSKAALFYIGPYINKDGVKITDALPILLKAYKHALNNPSVAEDCDTTKRRVQHAITRALNKMNNLIEVTDTQVAASLLGMGASLTSESFIPCDVAAFQKFVNDELQRMISTDSDSDEEKEYYDEMDISEDNDMPNENDNDEDGGDDNSVESLSVDDRSSDPMACEDTPLLDNAKCEGGDDFKYINASCGRSAPFYTMNDGTKQPVSYAALYRYRGPSLKHLNRYEYKACVQVEKKTNNEDAQDISTTGSGGRRKSKSYPFGPGLGIEKNYHQVLKSKQCIPKLTRGPPALPKIKPEPPDLDESDKEYNDQYQAYKSELAAWRKKADRFGHFYLTLFRPEDTLYEMGQICVYEYNWETFMEFVDQLRYGRRSTLDMYRLALINRVIWSWRVDKERRECLTAFRGRNRTMWSDEQKEAAKSHYGKFNRATRETDDGMDYITSIVTDLTEQQKEENKKHICHSKELLDTLKAAARPHDDSCVKDDIRTDYPSNSSSSIPDVMTLPFDSNLEEDKRRAHVTQKSIDDDNGRRLTKFPRHLNVDEKVDDYIASQTLSDDKNIAIKLAREHFDAIRSGKAESKSYQAPNLLICGKPGNGKSKIIETLDGIVEIMKVGEQMKCAYMGAAAVNIAGTTLLKPWNIPVFNKGDNIKFRPWNVDKLQALKRRFGNDIHNICAVVIDEISTVQPYMLAYLNHRMQEMFQVSDKPFGGRMVILVGDFQQKPPTAGDSLPGSVMKYVEKRGMHLTRDKATQLGPTQMGGFLFSKFRCVELTSQHRSEDPKHTAVLNKMSNTGCITVNDLKTYKKLSDEDLKSDDFRFATIIVTGNLERREINAWQAGRWAKHYGVIVVRWPRKRKEDTWKGKPNSMDGVTLAMHNSCFWELFIPGAKGYLNTYNINGEEGLANGTEIKYHSLSFKGQGQKIKFKRQHEQAQPGDVITIDSPPTAINVELFADFEDDTAAIKATKKVARKKWLDSGKCSITNDGRVVIHISSRDGSVIPYKTAYIPHSIDAESGREYPSSRVDMKDHFPVEPAFSITVDKAQVS